MKAQTGVVRPNSGHAFGRWNLLALIVIALFGVTTILRISPIGSATTPDSLAYLDLATQMASGNGWRATDFSLAGDDSSRTLVQRSWPPLYPAMLSVFVDNPYDVGSAARVSTLLYILMGWLTFLLLYRTLGTVFALGATMGCMLAVPVQVVFAYAWSESLFLPLLLLSASLSIAYLDSDPCLPARRGALAAMLAVTLVLAFFTRYIGLVLAILFPITYVLSARGRGDRWIIGSVTVLYLIPVVVLMGSNFMQTGSLSGADRMGAGGGLLENSQQALNVMISLFSGSLGKWLGCVVAGGMIAFALREANYPKRVNGRTALGIIVFCLVGAAYLVSLILMRSFSNFDEIDIRLLSPAVLSFLVALWLFSSRASNCGRVGVFVAGAGVSILLVLFVNGIEQARATATGWQQSQMPHYPRLPNSFYNNFTTSHVGSMVGAGFPEGLPQSGPLVVKDRGLVWRFLTHVRVYEIGGAFSPEILSQLERLPGGSLMWLPRPYADIVLQYFSKQDPELLYWVLEPEHEQSSSLAGHVLIHVAENPSATERPR